MDTKTAPPSLRPPLIDRSAVLGDVIGDSVVVLVHAPAGWGKTTLVAQWASSRPDGSTCWVSFDEGDDDPIAFWRYIVTAIHGVRPALVPKTLRALQDSTPSLRSVVLPTLLGEIVACEDPLVVVLDDFHLINESECLQTFRLVLDRLRGSVQFVITSRSEVSLGISRLVAQRRAAVISTDSLAFGLGETTELLEAIGGSSASNSAEELQRATEGWPVGVYLSALNPRSGQGSPGLGSMDLVERFLREEIMAGLTPGDRDFLRKSSVAGTLNESLCRSLTGEPDSGEILDRLSRTTALLSSTESTPRGYRIHHLLRDHLRRELATAPDAAAEQHKRAVRWYVENGEATEAIDHALKSGDKALASSLLSANWYPLVMCGRAESVWRSVEELGIASLAEYPFAVLAASWTALFRGDASSAWSFANLSKVLMTEAAPPDGSASFMSARALLLAALGIDGLAKTLDHAETALRLEPAGSPQSTIAQAMVGTAYVALGRIEEGMEWLGHAVDRTVQPDGMTVYALGQRALAEVWFGDVAEADRHSQYALALIDDLGHENLISSGGAFASAALVAANRGRVGMARRHAASLGRVLSEVSEALPFDACQLHLVAAEAFLAIGATGSAQVHAVLAARHLETLGDGGILEDRLHSIEQRTGHHVHPGWEDLTKRELEILRLLQTDMSVRDIGDQLFVSRNTAKSHISSIYRKLGVTDRSGAVIQARNAGLL